MYIDLPEISKNTPPALMAEEIRRYIYKSNEQINLALADCTPERIWEKSAAALESSKTNNTDEIKQESKRFNNLRDLIVKSAETVLTQDDKFSKVLNGSYVAKSDFGTFLMNTRLEVLEDSKTINELFTYAAEANEYRVFNTFRIDRGLLDDSDVAHPIYGLQLGLIDYSFLKDEHGDYILDGDGHRILVEKTDVNRFLRITPEKISLLSGNTEVASISEDNIYFPKAHITGGSINLSNNFKVTSDGTVTVKKGSINISNKFIVDTNGDAILKGNIQAEKFDLIYDNESIGDMGLIISPYKSSSKGISLAAPFIRFGSLLYAANGEYKNGLEEGFYTIDDTNNAYKGRTTDITINNTTYHFRDGLLVGSAIPLPS